MRFYSAVTVYQALSWDPNYVIRTPEESEVMPRKLVGRPQNILLKWKNYIVLKNLGSGMRKICVQILFLPFSSVILSMFNNFSVH